VPVSQPLLPSGKVGIEFTRSAAVLASAAAATAIGMGSAQAGAVSVSAQNGYIHFPISDTMEML
jgi:hypothetical protein